MKKLVFSFVLMIFLAGSLYSQQFSNYLVLDAEVESSSVVKLKIKTFCRNKKYVDAEAQCVAIKTVLFNGIPNTQYKKPLLDEGEYTSYDEHPVYFENLFTYRFFDFIQSYRMLSKFRKANDKSTVYEVKVKIIQLRKDLEKNNIRRNIGL